MKRNKKKAERKERKQKGKRKFIIKCQQWHMFIFKNSFAEILLFTFLTTY